MRGNVDKATHKINFNTIPGMQRFRKFADIIIKTHFMKHLPLSSHLRQVASSTAGGVLGGVITIALAIISLQYAPESVHTLLRLETEQPAPPAPTIQVSAIDVSDIVDQANPAVVSIVIMQDTPVMEQYFENPFGTNSPFQFMIPRYRQNGTEKKKSAEAPAS